MSCAHVQDPPLARDVAGAHFQLPCHALPLALCIRSAVPSCLLSGTLNGSTRPCDRAVIASAATIPIAGYSLLMVFLGGHVLYTTGEYGFDAVGQTDCASLHTAHQHKS